MEEKQKACSLTDVRIQIERLEVAQSKDMWAIRREIALMFEAKDSALKLKSAEDKIHFEKLNHEAEQLKRMQATYLPRESHELSMKDINKAITELTSFKDNLLGRMTIISAIIAVAVSILTYFIASFIKH